MLVSYIVPVYNVEKYLEHCLESILVQKGADYEILLIDDGSTDNSGLICDRYAGIYPDTVRVIHKKNEGLLLTRRRGFLEAKGDWFICVDSDDYIKPNHLQIISEAIASYDCDLIMFDYESVFPDGHLEDSGIDIKNVYIYEGTEKTQIYSKRLLKNKYNNMWSKAIKRSIVDFEKNYSMLGVKNMCEDAIQSYELYSRAKKIVFIPQALYLYRRDIRSITANKNMDYWKAFFVSYELGWKYVKLWNVAADISSAYAARCISFYCDFLQWLLSSGVVEERQKIRDVIDEYMLGRNEFTLAVKLCEKKFFATKYLKFRNPIVVFLVQKKAYNILKYMFRFEKMIRRE